MLFTFGSITDFPDPKTVSHCNECGWEGHPSSDVTDDWGNFYCCECGSDDVELRTLEFNDKTCEFEYYP